MEKSLHQLLDGGWCHLRSLGDIHGFDTHEGSERRWGI
jgi:hypothetical protein